MTGFARSLPKKKLPSYLLHKPTGQARVRIAGKDYYLDVPDRTPFWRSFTVFARFSGLSVAGAAGIASGSLDWHRVKKACFTVQGGIDAMDS